MNSCLYKAKVMHNRLAPKKHAFHYNVFMFYIDLDELEVLNKKLFLLSINKFNFFSFKDKEHLQLPINDPDKTKSTKQHIQDYLRQNGVTKASRIMLLTNLNVLGYNFNPVSFYYCFDEMNEPLCCVAEISNTFREMKPFFLGKDRLNGNTFHLNTTKYFYVSPFIEHDTNFDFNLIIPGEKLNIRIDDYKDGERFFISTLSGTKKQINNRNLFWYSIRFPFITLQIITLIHYNALRLWMKKIRYYKKTEHPDLQREVFNKYRE